MEFNQRRINALYVRVSTDGQQTGLESQIRALKDWCTRNQVDDYELFADEGISGAKESRPALNRLMTMVENNKVDQVIVFSFSRFARSTSHLLKGLKTFKEMNTRFISITESIDTNSPLGVALYTLSGQKTTKKQYQNDLRVIRRLREIVKSDQFWQHLQDGEYSL